MMHTGGHITSNFLNNKDKASSETYTKGMSQTWNLNQANEVC